MNYQKGNYILTEYGELPIRNVVFDQYQVTGKDGRILWANKVEPIEINKYKLIQFGFNVEDTHATKWINEDRTFIIAYKKDHWYLCDCDVDTHLKYIHELQNLYSAMTRQLLPKIPPINV